MRRKPLAVAIILITLCALMIPISSFADEERNDIIMEAQVGFDGLFRLGQWTPITVEIENNGKDIQGSLEVVANQNSITGMIFSRSAVVPGNSRKRFVLYVQVNSIQQEMHINLVEGGKTIKTVKIDGLLPLTWSKYLLGVVTDDKAGMSYWWNTLGSDTIFTEHETVHFQVQDLPDRKEVLDNFEILVFDNADTSLLTDKQKSALISWIEDGGILIAGTGANGNRILSGLTPEIIPLQPGEISTVNAGDKLSKIAGRNLPDNAMLQLMDLKSEQGEFIVQEGAHKLVWKLQLGSGYIFVSAFDLGLEPVIDWAGNKIFWAQLLSLHLDARKLLKLQDSTMRRDLASEYGTDGYYQIREALAGIKAMDIPSFTGLIILLLVYLAVVGPVNYIILKKLDKREWAWVTVPLLVVLFSAGIYAMGYTKKGSDVITNTISVVQLQPNGGSAQTDTYVGIFIPRKGDYTISVNDEILMTTFEEENRYYYSSGTTSAMQNKIIQAKVNQGNPSSVELYDANVWTMKLIKMTDAGSRFGTLESSLYYRNGKIKGQVTNNTPYPLSDLVIYTPYGYQKIGNIASGESKQVDFDISYSNSNIHVNNAMYLMVDEIYPYADLGNLQNEGLRERQIRRRILEGLLVRPYETKQGIPDDGSFVKAFAFCNANLGEEIRVNGKEPEQSYFRSLIMADLDLVYEKDGIVSIPPGFIRATINKELSDKLFPELGGYYLEQGQAVFTFPMEPYKEIELTKIEIKINAFYGNSSLSIYKADEQEFVEAGDGISIKHSPGTISIDPAVLNNYIDEQGNLQIKVAVQQRNSISLELPSLIIEGRRR